MAPPVILALERLRRKIPEGLTPAWGCLVSSRTACVAECKPCCLCSNKTSERKGVALGGWGGREDLEGVGGRETTIEIKIF